MNMFGVPFPVKADFRLGYIGDDDYWITHAEYSGDIPIGPGFNIKKIGGGLGRNFDENAFLGSVLAATPKPNPDGKIIFAADMTIGSPGTDGYKARGILTVIPSDTKAVMNIQDITLLGMPTQLKGRLELIPDGFTASIWGGVKLLNNLVWLDIEKNSTEIYIGKQGSHIYAGKQEGPWIKGGINIGDIIKPSVKVWYMEKYTFSEISRSVGASGGMNFNLGDCDILGFSAGFNFDLMCGISVLPSPNAEGHLHADVGYNICSSIVDVGCGGSVDANVKLIPPYAYAQGTAGCDTPLGEVTFTMKYPIVPPGIPQACLGDLVCFP
jgi:hypothetical protein